MNRDLRVLTFTSLYPSEVRPRHGIFIESRLTRLVARGGMQAHVVAPVPWFPFDGPIFGEYGAMAATARREVRGGIEVRYPRYLMIPRAGMRLQPFTMARAGLAAIRSLLRAGERFDLIDAHYLYPDGVAAAWIARQLKLPYVLSARGTDVNVIARMRGPGRRVQAAIRGANAVIAVSDALRRSLAELGVPTRQVAVLRNGVDAKLFFPADKDGARRAFGLPATPAPIVASVGNLVAEKGHDLVLQAAAQIEGLQVAVVGRGPERARLEQLAGELGIRPRVTFLDNMPQPKLRSLYCAADALLLASAREGWPNVLLEAAACGTPVAAFDVGGVSEVIGSSIAGIVIEGERSAGALADAVRRLLGERRDPLLVRQHALGMAWEPVLDAQLALYRIVARRGAVRPAVPVKRAVEA